MLYGGNEWAEDFRLYSRAIWTLLHATEAPFVSDNQQHD
jgi:hypothetical protein